MIKKKRKKSFSQERKLRIQNFLARKGASALRIQNRSGRETLEPVQPSGTKTAKKRFLPSLFFQTVELSPVQLQTACFLSKCFCRNIKAVAVSALHHAFVGGTSGGISSF